MLAAKFSLRLLFQYWLDHNLAIKLPAGLTVRHINITSSARNNLCHPVSSLIRPPQTSKPKFKVYKLLRLICYLLPFFFSAKKSFISGFYNLLPTLSAGRR